MKKISSILVVLCAFSLNACNHYSNKLASMQPAQQTVYADNELQNIAPAAGGAMTFRTHLRSQYLDLAMYENNVRKDYRAAKYYTNKIETLDQGQLVAPASLRNFNIDQTEQPELMQARHNLVEALELFSVPENRYALAMAQTRYDCWVDRAEERPEEAATCQCRTEYTLAMDTLVVPDPIFSEEEFYNDFFDVDIGG